MKVAIYKFSFPALNGLPGEVVVVLGSGDGTLNECITILSSAEFTGARSGAPPKVVFVLVPSGTANALYSTLFPPPTEGITDAAYRLQSLKSYLAGAKTIPLTLAITTLSSPPSARKRPQGQCVGRHLPSPANISSSEDLCGRCIHMSACEHFEGFRGPSERNPGP